MDATPVLHEKRTHGAGFIEIVVWSVPSPVPPSTHGFKYRLAYVVGGQPVVRYDDERGKGDHHHVRGRERRYAFVDVATLLADFMRDVQEAQR